MSVFNDPVQNVCAFACSRQGASHKAHGGGVSLCQDAYLISSGSFAGRAYVVAAVADGHGSARHDRSHIGSQLAVQAGVAAFQAFLLAHEENDHATLLGGFKRSFPTEVTREWRKAVGDHSDSAQGQKGPEYTRYGTTLLVAGIVDRLFFLAQVGDGDIVVTDEKQGQLQPLAVKDGLVAGETFSLCSQDAEKLWRTTTGDLKDISFITISTDGLRNAYDSGEAFLRLLGAVRNNIEQCGINRAASILPDALDRFSTNGSGDDITLIGLMVGNPSIGVQQKGSEGALQADAAFTPDSGFLQAPEELRGGDSGSEPSPDEPVRMKAESVHGCAEAGEDAVHKSGATINCEGS